VLRCEDHVQCKACDNSAADNIVVKLQIETDALIGQIKSPINIVDTCVYFRSYPEATQYTHSDFISDALWVAEGGGVLGKTTALCILVL